MTTLRTAAQQALEALEDDAMQRTFAGGVRISNAALALRAALAEPDRAQKMRDAGYTRRPTLREMAEPAQEPVAYAVGRTLHWHEGKGVNDAKLYLAPPQRKPMPIDQIYEMYNEPCSDAEMVEFARAVERAHGIT